MKKLLVTGASGFLGWHCCHANFSDWKIFGTSTSAGKIEPKHISKIQMDLTDENWLWSVIKEVKPDAVFHLAAHSGTNYCEKFPDSSRPLNVGASANLAKMCADRGIKLIFTSSEQIFDGQKGDYSETDQPAPKNKYGEQKWQAEQKIQEINPEAVIVRIAVLYGKSSNISANFLTQWLDAWGKSLSVMAFHDEIRQFLSARNCVDALFHLLDQGAEGIFHVGGSSALNRLEFAKLVKSILVLENAKIIDKSQSEIEMLAYRPVNLSLNCQKILSTGFKLTDPYEELKFLKPNLNIKPTISLN